jgi:LuxR family transcriptional regulator, regulator of acetate metabolism
VTAIDPGADRQPASARIGDLRQALGRLREARSLAKLCERATEEACRGLGFHRAVLFGVRGAELVVESAHVEGADGDGKAAVEAQSPDRLLEVVRRRSPMSALDQARAADGFPLDGDPVPFAAAPVMPRGSVIAVLYCDRRLAVGGIDDVDVEVVCSFAETVGYAVEGIVLRARLATQRERVQKLLGETAAALDAGIEADLDLASEQPAEAGGALHEPAGVSIAIESGLEELLTRRELEVLALMAAGISNAGIASRLVISEYTVKSHVKSILRKLRADNRAEAVSRYLLALQSGRRRLVGRRREDFPLGIEPFAGDAA